MITKLTFLIEFYIDYEYNTIQFTQGENVDWCKNLENSQGGLYQPQSANFAD